MPEREYNSVDLSQIDAEAREALIRRHEVVRAGGGLCVLRQRVTQTVLEPGHVLQHLAESPLVGAESDEHRAVVGHGAVGHVAAEDLAEVVLVGPSDVRVVGLVLELDAVVLPPADHLLLFRHGERFPGSRVVAPLLQQEDRAAGARAVRDHRELRRFDQGRVLAAVDEAGEISVVLVRPARGLLRDRRDVVQRGDCLASGLEDDVVRTSRQPEDGVVLRRRHPVALGAHEVRVEALKAWWRVVGCDRTPEVWTEAGDEVDAAHRRARLAQRGDRSDESRTGSFVCIELEVRVRRRAEREHPCLRGLCHFGASLRWPASLGVRP